jgi:hypothetical protein
MPEPRIIGPLNPKFKAFLDVTIPTSIKRFLQIQLPDKSSSISSIQSAKSLTNE